MPCYAGSVSELYPQARIETPEQLSLELRLAGIGSRSMAFLLDMLIQLVPVLAAAVPALLLLRPAHGPFLENSGTGIYEPAPWPLAVFGLVLFAVNFGYFAFFEIAWRGQTPGKRWLRLRVLRDGGFPIDGRAALIRNLLRVVDILPAFYALGLVCLFFSREGKRLGDLAAGTIVACEPDAPLVPLERGAPAPASGPLTAAETALVHEFLERAPTLDPGARERLARRVGEAIALRLGEPAPFDPEHYLATLVDRP